ncbi:lysostaphin resistance A-like protein [Pedobacter sp. N23S346]|uniref:CPBP family intramembrane glutamic endopeptidase n=1 Tax=Pedobacter sp. N23S346 TaxID=3402750 RepID=UPI003ACCC28E
MINSAVKLKNASKNPIVFIIIFSFFLLIVSFLYDYFTEVIGLKYGINAVQNNEVHDRTLTYKLILACFIAPILETYFFQSVPYHILKEKKFENWKIILCSAILFGLLHFSNLAYLLFGFFSGIVLIVAYIYWEGTRLSKVIIVCIIHVFHNILVLFSDLVNLK